MKKLIEYFAKQTILVNLVTIFTMLAGIYAIFKIQRETFPNISFDIITVTTSFPGASAESIERLITNPLEQDLNEVDGIKKLTSVSADGQSVIVIQLDPDQTTAEIAESDIEDVTDSFTSLPDEAELPVVTVLESKRNPIVEIGIAADNREADLRSAAKYLERKVEALPEVAKIQFNGLRDYEIRVEAQPDKLLKFQVSIQDIINALRMQNLTIPGGIIETRSSSDREVVVRTVGEFERIEEIENTVIRANALASAIRIKDVAFVSKEFERSRLKMRTNGLHSINLTVLKKESADAITLVENLKHLIESEKSSIGPNISISVLNDMSQIISRRLNVLSSNLFIGLGLVILVLGSLLPVRIALVVAVGIPFTFLGTILFFYGAGISLNLISMMGLIIVVGMLVDDAVVVTENCQSMIEKGESAEVAAIEGTKDIWLPVASSVLTTVAAFLPLMFMSGIFGKFVRYIPMGVIIALLISLAQAYFILPNHFIQIMRNRRSDKPAVGLLGGLWVKLVEQPYGKLVELIVRRRWISTFVFIGFLIVTGVVAKNKSSFVLFPKGGIDVFMVNLEADVGVSLDEMERLVLPAEVIVSQIPQSEMNNYSTRIGRQMQDENRSKSGTHFAQIIVFLTPETERVRTVDTIIEELRQKMGIPKGIKKISFELAAGGPPVGKAVSIGVRGSEYEEIMKVVSQLKTELSQIDGVKDIEDNYIAGRRELLISVKDEEAAAASLSVRDVGTTVRAAFEGIVATSIRKLEEEVDIRVMLPITDRASKESLDELKIPNMRGQLIPLAKISRQTPEQGLSTYEHEANQRQVRVTADIDESKSSSIEVNKKMKTWAEDFAKGNRNISFAFGGEDQDTQESMQTLMVSFIFALVGIIFLLILTFDNLTQPFLVSISIPMGIVSVIWTFILHSRPLSFLAMMGVVALGGVIVNNSILIIDAINKMRAGGMDRFESVKIACQSRLRPIFLTSFTTVAGMLPTAYGIGGLDPFVVPMALALGWGLALGSVLTVLFFPAIVVVVDDLLAFFSWSKNRTLAVVKFW